MERIRDYFDRVKADDELKEKTKSYIREMITLENEKSGDFPGNQYRARDRKYTLKRLSIAVFPIAACLVILIGGYTYYKTPVNYVSLDINPSVELGLNHFDRVVEAEGINADGNSLLDGIDVMNMSVDDAIKRLVSEAQAKDYINPDGSTVIAITAFSSQEEAAVKLSSQMAETLRTMMAGGALHVVIYTDNAGMQMRTEAREHGFSPGKYKLITMLQSLDPDIETEQYRNMGMTDLLEKANELLQKKEVITKPEQISEPNMKQNTEQDQTGSGYNSAAMDTKPNVETAGQEESQTQNQGTNQETSPPSVEAGPDQAENQVQSQMTDEPAEGHEQSNKPDSSGGQGGSQNNKQGPN